jgi:hypothetical protein
MLHECMQCLHFEKIMNLKLRFGCPIGTAEYANKRALWALTRNILACPHQGYMTTEVFIPHALSKAFCQAHDEIWGPCNPLPWGTIHVSHFYTCDQLASQTVIVDGFPPQYFAPPSAVGCLFFFFFGHIRNISQQGLSGNGITERRIWTTFCKANTGELYKWIQKLYWAN